MANIIQTLDEHVEEKVEQHFSYDANEIESHTIFNPERKFYDFENRIDCFGLVNDIPPFSGKFIA